MKQKYIEIKDLDKLVFPSCSHLMLPLESIKVPEASDEEDAAHTLEPQGTASNYQ